MHRRETRAMVSVGGARNQVVKLHQNMCHHCGFHAIPISHKCARCGIQCHNSCGSPICDVCENGGREAFPNCILCDKDDPACEDATSTDRLAMRIVYHGHRWKKTTENLSSHRFLASESHVAEELKANPDRHFRMDELPFHGRHPMMLFIEKVGFFESVPMVVHSWCVSCLFQINPALDDDWKERLLQRMSSCPTRSFGSLRDSVTRGGVPCQFCGDDNGWLTFCMYHNIFPAGCDRCRDASDRSKTYHAFHPSCAVRHGMQRKYKRMCGMFCARHKTWRSRRLETMKPWLGFVSGINLDIVDHSWYLATFRLALMFPSKARTLETV